MESWKTLDNLLLSFCFIFRLYLPLYIGNLSTIKQNRAILKSLIEKMVLILLCIKNSNYLILDFLIKDKDETETYLLKGPSLNTVVQNND